MNKKIIVTVTIIIVLVIVLGLWISGIIPKQIARIYATNYLKKHFPKMNLEYVDIKWETGSMGNYYNIRFKDENDKIYGFRLDNKYFPMQFGQGIHGFMEKYMEKYENTDDNITTTQFTKTYYVLSDLGVTDQTGEYNYYTIGQYQMGEPIVVKINSKYKLEANKNYEFSFEGIEKGDKKYSIQEIFDTFNIIDIKLTDKLGMEQTQDEIKIITEQEDPRLIKNVEAKDIRYEKEIDNNIKIRAIYGGSILGQKEIIIIGKTTDGGKTWYNQAEMYDGENVNIGAQFVFLDENIGFINNLQTVVNNDTQRGLLVTVDGGKHFTTAKFTAPQIVGKKYLYVDGVPYIENGKLKVKTYSIDYNKDPAKEYYEFYSEDNGITWKYIK